MPRTNNKQKGTMKKDEKQDKKTSTVKSKTSTDPQANSKLHVACNYDNN